MQKGEDKSVFAFTWLDEPNACPGCFWQDRAFEVAERSEVGALESLASNLVRLAALGALVSYQKRLPNIEQSFFISSPIA